MLTRKERISIFKELGGRLSSGSSALEEIEIKAYNTNKWFTVENIKLAIKSICESYLDPLKLDDWLAKYPDKPEKNPKSVGLIMAGNLPLVGFHDFLSVFVSGHIAKVKLSEKDKILFPFILDLLQEIDPRAVEQVELVERLKDFDAVIATGSNNSARYFDYYFGKYPSIIRKNRTSVGILTGEEDESDLTGLGKDVFRYFGLGCRNVSKIYVPTGYDFVPLLEKFQAHEDIILHNKYKNNFDYILTLLILNKIPYLSNSCLLLHEDTSLHSRIASLHYEYYDSLQELERDLIGLNPEIQCVVSKARFNNIEVVPFGETQQPGLEDYADGIDTLNFLMNL